MSQANTAPEPDVVPAGGLLVVCSERDAEAVRKAISRQAYYNWEPKGEIHLLTIPDFRRSYKGLVTRLIESRLQEGSRTQHVIVLKDISCDQDSIQQLCYKVMRPNGVYAFALDVLPTVLKVAKLDWKSYAYRLLSNGWRHGSISEAHITAWVRQFERLGHDWVAEGLLKVLDFWDDSRVRTALNITPENLEAFDCVCVNHHRAAGKSAGVIASLVQKQLEGGAEFKRVSRRVRDLREALESNDAQDILFVEDCMVTGNEMTRILLDLQNIKHDFGGLKADPLTDPIKLRGKRIYLRFAVVTNGSLAYVQRFLKQHGLENIEIDSAHSGVIDTLTPEGLSDLAEDCLIDTEDCLIDPNRSVIRSAFLPTAIWHSDKRRQRAIEFCTEIGFQLYKLYVQGRSKPWIERKVEESALGVRSHALSLAFTHSVPKETLPLYWAGGRVRWQNKEIDWLPLFQNAL